MSDTVIQVNNLRKVYRVHERPAGFWSSLRSLFRRQFRQVEAVKGITFSIERGEVVGFLGPNGAGKTTTLKILSGLLHPTDGTATVLGHTPWYRRHDYLRQISLVMGNRSQLHWDIPAMDSFLVNQVIYNIPEKEFQETLRQLVELLDLEGVIRKPIRNLSLGERMKCELAASLLHRPHVLFLDEPTLGVDVTMQSRIRRFIADYNRLTGATVLLTSHYMADVTALCKRVIVIHHGSLLYDGDLQTLGERVLPYKVIRVDLSTPVACADLEPYGDVMECSGLKAVLRVPRCVAPDTVATILKRLSVADLSVEDPPIEEVIDLVFAGKGDHGAVPMLLSGGSP